MQGRPSEERQTPLPNAAPPALSACPLNPPTRLSWRGPKAPALTREDTPVPSEEGGPHREATVGAVGGLLGLLAGDQQLLDVLGLQGAASRTLLGHVGPGVGGGAELRAGGQPGLGPPCRQLLPGECPSGRLPGALLLGCWEGPVGSGAPSVWGGRMR